MDPQWRMLSYARLNIGSRSSLAKEIEITASFQQSVEKRNSQKNGNVNLIREKDKINTIGFTTDILSVFNSRWTANSGIEMYQDKVNSSV